MRIGKGNKIKAKCPKCGRATCDLERSSTRLNWLVYECYKCNLKFRLPRGWRKRNKEEGGGDT